MHYWLYSRDEDGLVYSEKSVYGQFIPYQMNLKQTRITYLCALL